MKNEKLWTVTTVVLLILLSILGAIIGIQLLTSLGVTPNTAIIGALIAMLMARLPVKAFAHFRSVHVQNLAQTAISSATFGAANSLLLPIAVPFVMGRPDLVVPMLAGVGAAMLLDAYILYRLFDSRIFPATAAWPLGVAAASVIQAGDKGGRQSHLLIAGVIMGVAGAYAGLAMSAFGIAFLGNIWALSMFGIGLLIKVYSQTVAGLDIAALYLPHGFMVGAGLVALIQVIFALKSKKEANNADARPSDDQIPIALGIGGVGYILIAIFLAVVTGIYSDMSTGMLIGFIVYAGFAAFFHELIVGIAAMHSGWFPAFAVALITLLIGMLIGFPVEALAVLAAYSAATGPAFADMGYDLKAGFILRNNGANLQEELYGRRAQLISAMLAFVIAIIVVYFYWEDYFTRDLIPPIARVYNHTILAGTSLTVAKQLAIWAIPGAIIQFIGGPKRQMGIMLSTGLLIGGIQAGWAVILGIFIRSLVLKLKGDKYRESMEIMAAGCIAGDAMYSFVNNLFKIKAK